MRYDTFYLSENKPFPNSTLPVIVYKEVFEEEREDYGDGFLELFIKHGWGNSWRNGIYPFHHYHAKAHEVLGCAKGWVKIQLGGEGGKIFEIKKGEAVLLPAGVGHCRIESSDDFSIIGAYPHDQSPDMNKGKENYERNQKLIQKVQKPDKDPITGLSNPAVKEWE